MNGTVDVENELATVSKIFQEYGRPFEAVSDSNTFGGFSQLQMRTGRWCLET